jgi:hypothetical protein
MTSASVRLQVEKARNTGLGELAACYCRDKEMSEYCGAIGAGEGDIKDVSQGPWDDRSSISILVTIFDSII